MRDTAKHIVEMAIRAAGLTRLALHRRRTETIVLAYHNIVPEGEVARGDTSLHLPQRLFARQLDLLRETHTIIPLSELTAPHDDARPRAVITFDDAYCGAVTAGVTELSRRGLPATIFVAPAFVGGGSFWWDEFANDSGLPAELRERALSSLRGEDERVRTWADGAKLPRQTVPRHETVASEAELHAAIAMGGITLGSHTWSHPNCVL